jgi:hypothetical protein
MPCVEAVWLLCLCLLVHAPGVAGIDKDLWTAPKSTPSIDHVRLEMSLQHGT